MNTIVEKAREFAVRVHAGQKYGTRPYAVHLKAVANQLERWGCSAIVIAGGWLHDTIEDTMDPLTIAEKRNVIRSEFGKQIEDIVWACTGDSTARAIAFEQQMSKLYGFRLGALVKAADRLCNMTAVADDLEFETDEKNMLRLVRIGHDYLAEFEKFSSMVNLTVENMDINISLQHAQIRVRNAVTLAAQSLQR